MSRPPGTPPLRVVRDRGWPGMSPMGAAAMNQETVGADSQRGAGARVPSGATITILRGFYEGLEIPVVSDWFVIGRGKTADAILAEPTISRAHAAIGWSEHQGFYVEDLGSTNGTLVNGERQQQQALASGDLVQIGKLRLRVSLPGGRA